MLFAVASVVIVLAVAVFFGLRAKAERISFNQRFDAYTKR